MLKKLLTLFIAACFTTSAAEAQLMRAMNMYNSYMHSSGAGKRMWQRYYLGGGITAMDIRLEHHYYGPDNYEKIIRQKLPSVTGYTVTEGFFFPFSRPKTGGTIGLDVATTASTYTYNIGTLNYDANNTVTETGEVYSALIPIAFCYKSGGEVTLNKQHRNLFTFGVGFAPGYTYAKMVDIGVSMSARKFIMAEYGFLAGIAFKVRGTAFLGDMTVISTDLNDFRNADSYVGNDLGSVKMSGTGKSSFALTVMIMPFSWDWKRPGSMDFY